MLHCWYENITADLVTPPLLTDSLIQPSFNLPQLYGAATPKLLKLALPVIKRLCRFCLLVELHWEESAPAAFAAGLFSFDPQGSYTRPPKIKVGTRWVEAWTNIFQGIITLFNISQSLYMSWLKVFQHIQVVEGDRCVQKHSLFFRSNGWKSFEYCHCLHHFTDVTLDCEDGACYHKWRWACSCVTVPGILPGADQHGAHNLLHPQPWLNIFI